MRRRVTLVAALLAVSLGACAAATTSPTQVATPSSAAAPSPSPSASGAAQAWPSGFREGFCSTASSDLSAILDQLQTIAATARSGDVQGTVAGATKVAAMAATAREHLASLPAWPEAAPTIQALSLALADLEAGAEAVVTGANTNDMTTFQRGITALGNYATSLNAATGLLQGLTSRTGLTCP